MAIKEKAGIENILILVDNPTDCNRLEFGVERSGLRSASADSCEKAMKLLKGNSMAGMFIDIHMDNGNSGIAFLKRMKRMKHVKNIPKIAVSTYPLNSQREEVLREGFDDYITRPFTVEKVKRILFYNLTVPNQVKVEGE